MMYFFKKILGFINLYRIDVAILFILVYFLASFFAQQSFSVFNLNNFILSILISFISINFTYSFNSLSDVDIDKINKPNRPIPSGLISVNAATFYCIFLAFVSIIYPFVFFGVSFLAFLSLLLFFIGFLYSYKRLGIKKNKILSIIFIILSCYTTFLLGYIKNNGNLNFDFFVISIVFIFASASIIPMKDISDVVGDSINKSENWFNSFSKNRIFLISNILLFFCLLLSFFISFIYVKIVIILNISSYFVLFVWFLLFKKDFKNFYKKLLTIFSFNGLLFILFCMAYYLLNINK